MNLQLHSTLGREKRPFRTVEPDVARIYVCGVTPYDVTHLGHAFSYVQFDALRRYLMFLGYTVNYVQNVTDIDDDMIRVSRLQGGRPIAEIRDENDAIFRNDMDRMNVLRPTSYPFATDHIPQIIEATARLIENGHAYEVDGDVFFETSTFERYGALNGVPLAELGKLENPESKRAHKKRGHLDFLLWQLTEPDEPSWESPWGPGRPGWSIECTAMSMAHLGEQIDIHGGGSDLRFPHHENEIAQAESVSGLAPYCGYWMHNGMLSLEGVKMSKSLGNLVLARDLMKEVDPDHLRLYLLTNHYRADPDYRRDSLHGVEEMFQRFRAAAVGAGASGAPAADFLASLDDDFDVPRALAAADASAARILAGSGDDGEAADLRAGLAILGFAFAGAPGPTTTEA